MGDENTTGSTHSLRERLSRVASELRDGLRRVVDELPINEHKPAEFVRVLKLDRSVSSRLLRAIQHDDPLAMLHRMPGPQGVRLMLQAALKVGACPQAVQQTDISLFKLEELVSDEIGSWQDLVAAISGWVPEARAEFELSNRQKLFRISSNLYGMTARATVSLMLVGPSESDPDWADMVLVFAFVGLRRIRPGAHIKVANVASSETPVWHEYTSLGGEPIVDGCPPLLTSFSTVQPSDFDISTIGDSMQVSLTGEEVGFRSAVDVTFGHVVRRRYPRTLVKAIGPGAYTGSPPTRAMVTSVVVHKDVWPGTDPELHTYDINTRGVVDVTEPSSEFFRLDPIEEIETVQPQAPIKDFPRYNAVLEHACAALGWDPSAFRAYRCRMDYPVPGVQISLVFS